MAGIPREIGQPRRGPPTSATFSLPIITPSTAIPGSACHTPQSVPTTEGPGGKSGPGASRSLDAAYAARPTTSPPGRPACPARPGSTSHDPPSSEQEESGSRRSRRLMFHPVGRAPTRQLVAATALAVGRVASSSSRRGQSSLRLVDAEPGHDLLRFSLPTRQGSLAFLNAHPEDEEELLPARARQGFSCSR